MPRKTPVKAKTATPQKVASVKKAPPKPVEPEEDSSEEESEEEEVMEMETAKVVKGAKQNGKKVAEEDDDDDDDEDEEEDDDDDEEEEPAAVTKKSKKAAAQVKKVTKAAEPEEDDDDDDDSEDDDDEEMAEKKVDEDDDDDDDDEEEDDDDDEDDDAEEGDAKEKGKKRKAKSDKPGKAQPEKKAKVEEGDLVRLFITISPDEEKTPVEKKIKKLFSTNDLEISNFSENETKNGRHWFVEVATGDLDKATALSGNDIKGSTIKIQKSRQREQQKGGADNCLLFVKNIPFTATNDEVLEQFPGCKNIRMPQRNDGSIKGFGFLEFETEAEVDAAYKAKQGAQMGSNTLVVDYVGPKSKNKQEDSRKSVGEAGKTTVLFVKNLSYDLDTDSLKNEFEGAESARIATFADSGKPRGFGFITFGTTDLCSAAYESMQGATIMGREVVVDYASEQPPRGGFSRGGGGRGGRGGFRGRGGGGGGGGYGGGRGGGRGRGDFRGGRGGRGGGGRW